MAEIDLCLTLYTRIRTANVLLIGMRALAAEVAKNLVLAGINSLTIVDHEIVTENDLCSNFFLSESSIGLNRAEAAVAEIRKLNPRVQLNVDISDVRAKDPSFYIPFDITIATDLDFGTLSTINASTRLSNRPFYAAGAHGFYGFIFADLITHDYIIERQKSNMPTTLRAESSTRSITNVSTKKEAGQAVELVTKREIYTPLLLANSSPLPPSILNSRRRLKQVTPLLTCLRALWDFEKTFLRLPAPANPALARGDLEAFTTLATEKHAELQLPGETLRSEFLRSFLQNLGSELAPVTAFLGGMLAQDVINVLGKRQQPIQNLVCFDGNTSEGPVFALAPMVTSLDGVGDVNGAAVSVNEAGAGADAVGDMSVGIEAGDAIMV